MGAGQDDWSKGAVCCLGQKLALRTPLFSSAYPDDRLHWPGHGQCCTLLAATGLAQPGCLVKPGWALGKGLGGVG